MQVTVQDIIVVIEIITSSATGGQIMPPNCDFLVADIDSNGILNIQGLLGTPSCM